MSLLTFYSQKAAVSKPKPKPSAEDLEPSRRSLRIQKIQPNGEPMQPPPPPPIQVILQLKHPQQHHNVLDIKQMI